MGKSTAMYNLVEDSVNLEGAGTMIGGTIIDPHGDLCQDIAAESHLKSSILFDILSFLMVRFPLMCTMWILLLQKIRLLNSYRCIEKDLEGFLGP